MRVVSSVEAEGRSGDNARLIDGAPNESKERWLSDSQSFDLDFARDEESETVCREFGRKVDSIVKNKVPDIVVERDSDPAI
jgi:hypothetical protein